MASIVAVSLRASCSCGGALPRKAAEYMLQSPVPQTDTGGWVEDTKVLGRFTAKELGKITL